MNINKAIEAVQLASSQDGTPEDFDALLCAASALAVEVERLRDAYELPRLTDARLRVIRLVKRGDISRASAATRLMVSGKQLERMLLEWQT